MKKILIALPWVFAFLLTGCATEPPSSLLETAVPAAETKPPEPMESLMAMAEKVAGADRISVTLYMGYDVLQDSGQKIAFREQRRILLNRPGQLRTEALQSDGDSVLMVFDGKTMSLFKPGENVYANIEFVGELDSLVRFAINDLGIRVPLAWMLLSTLPQDLKKLTKELVYVERDVLDDPATHHIAGRTDIVDYQFWIGPDHLPKRIFLTYRNEPGEPQFWAEFADWNLKPKLAESIFTFTPPVGAEQIPFVIPQKKPVEAKPKTRSPVSKRVQDDEF